MRTQALALLAGSALAVLASAPASAAVVVVQAQANSSSGGTPLDTGFNFVLGDLFTVSASTNDLWSAGALPRYSDADGLTGNRVATAIDDSGQAPGTQIGADFGLHMQDGFSAPFGALVGRIGGIYQLLGTSFSGPAWSTGLLELLYWDSNSADNFGGIDVTIEAAGGAIPEPATWAMMVAGFGLAGAAMRRSRKRVSVTYA